VCSGRKGLNHGSTKGAVSVNYSEIVKECKTLSTHEKLSLSVLLIQMARKEEEARNPRSRAMVPDKKTFENATDCEDKLKYVMERLSKLRPIKMTSLLHSLQTMYQFKGGLSSRDAEAIIAELEKIKFLKILDKKLVQYLKQSDK
jgi:hypothetical protein